MGDCPLCGRPLSEASSDRHHLIPKTFKGKVTVTIHKMCHNAIHATFTERELAKHYHTIERILTNECIQRFVVWIRNKDVDFYQKTKDNKQRKRKRRAH